jgi:CHAT domain-containing protein
VRRVTFCIREAEKCREIAQELLRLAGTELFQDIEVTFDTKVLPATVVRDRGVKPSQASAASDAAYLIIRQEASAAGSATFRSSLLTAGAKAAVITGQRTLKRTQLAEFLAPLGTSQFGAAQVGAFGKELASQLLAPEVLAVLPTVAQRPLVIVHDAAASQIPWELMSINGQFPVLQNGLSRRYLADNMSVAKWLEGRRQNPKLKILLVVNPNRGESMSLSGAEEEGARVQKLFAADSSVELTLRAGSDATRTALLQEFRSGKYDLVHYAGHAYFDAQEPSRSGILCHGGEVLSGADLATLGNLPNLVVFNACESGRVRSITMPKKAAGKSKVSKNGKAGKTAKKDEPTAAERVQNATGMAEAFLRGGISNYVGTYWPVGDNPAVTFASTFYPALLRGETVGEALLKARRTVKEQAGTVDWADYVHYGNQNFVLKTRGSGA